MYDDATSKLSCRRFLLFVHRQDLHLLVYLINSTVFKCCFPIRDLNSAQTRGPFSILMKYLVQIICYTKDMIPG